MLRIEQMKPYDRFVNTCKSEITKKEYTACLRRFMTQYQIQNYDAILHLSVKEMGETMIDYILTMKKRNLSEGYVSQQIAAVRHFLSMNDVVLNWDKIIMYKGEFKRKNKAEGYTHEQIQKLLEICDIRSRMVVLLLASTGIRIGALPELRKKNLKKIGDIYQLTVYEGYREEYITFCTPECASAIDNYLSFRERQGEKINTETYLVRQQFDLNDLSQIRSDSRPITKSTMRNVLWNLMIRAGLREVNHEYTKSQRKNIPQLHGFRYFFSTQLVNSNLNSEKRWLLEGHNLKANDQAYVKVEKELLAEYRKAITLLTINPENRLKEEVKELEADRDEITLLKLEHRKEMKRLGDEKESQEKRLKAMEQTQKEILECMKDPEKLVRIANSQ